MEFTEELRAALQARPELLAKIARIGAVIVLDDSCEDLNLYIEDEGKFRLNVDTFLDKIEAVDEVAVANKYLQQPTDRIEKA